MAEPGPQGREVDQRSEARKLLRLYADLKIDGMPMTQVKTTDLSSNGIGIIVGSRIETGLSCVISFQVSERILIKGTIGSCVLDADGYRVGIQIVQVHANCEAAFKKLFD